MAIDPEKYKHLTSDNKSLKVDFRPLNFDKLLAAKAVRVTNQGNQSGGFSKDPAIGFSLVSGYNDEIGDGGGTAQWPDNPKFYNVVKEMMTARPHDIGTHKYLQIIQSAKDMGLQDEDIFLPVQNKIPMPVDYRFGGQTSLI